MPLPGNVIRREEAERLTPVPFQFSDVRALAARILKRAQEQADQKIAAARAQVAQIEKAAQDKGQAEGFAKGEKAGRAKGEADGRAAAAAEGKRELEKERALFREKTEPLAAALGDLAAFLEERRQSLVAQAESDLLLLSMDMARRLTAHELRVNPDAVRGLVREAVSLVTERSMVTVRLNPEDALAMEDELPSLRKSFADLGSLAVEPDPSIPRGGVVAATRETEVDMRLSTRLAAFEQAILGFSGPDAEPPWERPAGEEPAPSPAEPSAESSAEPPAGGTVES